MSIRATATVVGVAVVLAACVGEAQDAAPTSPAPSSPAPSSPASATPIADADRPVSPCERAGTEVAGSIASADLTEASGLAASRNHPGVLWSHNDGGARPGVFAIGPDGSDLGFHALPVDAFDIEDMAIATNDATGDMLYLADIGDNGEQRASVSVFRFAEPDPAVPGPIEAVERFDFTYPDRPHNAETLLVDERSGRIVIVTKEQVASAGGRPDPLGATEVSLVFEGILDPASGASPTTSTTTLTEVGAVDTLRLEALASNSTLHPSTIFGFGGVITGGDVSADGSFVALRTYEAVWVWPRGDDRSVAQSVADASADPCQVVSISELQGEAIAFDGDELVTLGEGGQQPINRLAR